MIVISKYFVPKGFIGLTIFPFVFLKCNSLKNNKYLLNHERIHIRQQIEMLVIPFFIIYGIEFLVRLFQYRKWSMAYNNISFEREAYAKEKDLEYLQSRPLFNFITYIRK